MNPLEQKKAMDELREYMTFNNLTPRQMSIKLGVHDSQMYKWLKDAKIGRLWVEKLRGMGYIK